MKKYWDIYLSIFICMLLGNTLPIKAQPEPKGRFSYIHVKPFLQYSGELLTIRDSFLIVHPYTNLTNKMILKHIDSIQLLPLKRIQYVKLVEEKSNNYWKAALIGTGIGGGYALINYFSKPESERKNFKTHYYSLPIGLAVGYFFGLFQDNRAYKPEYIFYPEEKGFAPLKSQTRFSEGEPSDIKQAIDKKIEE